MILDLISSALSRVAPLELEFGPDSDEAREEEGSERSEDGVEVWIDLS